MDIRYFIGIDITKVMVDWAVYEGKEIVLQTTTPNTIAGIKTAFQLIKALPDWNPQQAVFWMEHTGIYNAYLLDFLHKLHFPIWLESSLQIKKAGGLQRQRPTRLMLSELPNTLSALAISFDSGIHHVRRFKNYLSECCPSATH